jgi:hypothetical protein
VRKLLASSPSAIAFLRPWTGRKVFALWLSRGCVELFCSGEAKAIAFGSSGLSETSVAPSSARIVPSAITRSQPFNDNFFFGPRHDILGA